MFASPDPSALAEVLSWSDKDSTPEALVASTHALCAALGMDVSDMPTDAVRDQWDAGMRFHDVVGVILVGLALNDGVNIEWAETEKDFTVAISGKTQPHTMALVSCLHALFLLWDSDTIKTVLADAKAAKAEFEAAKAGA